MLLIVPQYKRINLLMQAQAAKEIAGQETKDQDQKYAGLTKGQIKSLKEKEKKERQRKQKEQKQLAQAGKATEQDSKQAKEGKEGKEGGKKKKEKESAAAKIFKKNQEIKKQFEDKRKKEEQEQQRKIDQENQRIERERKEVEAKKKAEREEKERKFKEDRKDGLLMTKRQLEQRQRTLKMLDLMRQSDQKHKKEQDVKPLEHNAIYIPEEKKEEHEQQKTVESNVVHQVRTEFPELRSAIVCILGHVDTGKTTLLDKLRNTNVQQNEAGGITQQIGATYFPPQKLREQVSKCSSFIDLKEIPDGLLVIDTPGHESFANLRSRGNSLCDIAILVIDQMHGLQKQTLQSMQLLRQRNTPFVVALNKIDRNYEWEAHPWQPSKLSLERQKPTAKSDFRHRLDKVQLQMKQKGYNPVLYWDQTDQNEEVALVPTSGVTGEGIPDLLAMIVKRCTTGRLREKIKFNMEGFKCTVMQKKMVDGHGTTVDCLLVDGVIRKDDHIVLLGFEGAIRTKVKALLTPHPMKEMRVKGQFLTHDEIWGANGVKIAAKFLENAVVGTPLFVVRSEEDQADAVKLVESELKDIKKKIKLSPLGVGVAASTLGSLQALIQYLKSVQIPVSYVTVGPVSKEDVMLAMKSVLAEDFQRRKEEFACLLVFDIKVLPEAQKFAEENKIKIFSANIIYHLTDQFSKFVKQLKDKRKKEHINVANFPVMLKTVSFFRRQNPIVLGVDVVDGQLRVGTKLCVFNKGKVDVGVVQSIESNHKPLQIARRENGSVAIKINSKCAAGKDFQMEDQLCSKITRQSIDVLKEHFRDEMQKEDWQLVIHLKKFYGIE